MSGQSLIDFCEAHDLFVANSAFQHRAAHVSTWESKRTINNKLLTIYNQIDYILCSKKMKRNLLDSRSYGGATTSSDHRIVISRIDVRIFNIFMERNLKTSIAEKIDGSQVDVECRQREYHDNLNSKLKLLCMRKWDDVTECIRKAATETFGCIKRRKHTKSNPEIAELSEKQKEIRMRMRQEKKVEKYHELRCERRQILKKIHTLVRENKNMEIDRIVTEVDTSHNSAMMFSAVRVLNRKPYENPFVNDEKGHRIASK